MATEYIKMLVANPQCYRQILAVTFTNKATEEMKMRVLSQLYGIWRQLPSSSGYAQKVQQELQVSPDYVARQAGIALKLLLHNYSYFRVETIDSFFQSVLRNLARELDLTANLRIGLNDWQVEELAVDQLIDNLKTTDVMLQWLLKYIMDSIGDDRSWNVIGPIKKFGKTIFRDYYKLHSQELYQVMMQPHFFDHYTKSIRQIRTAACERMKNIAETFFSELTGAGFTIDDLSYGKSGVAGFFLKLRNGIFDESILGKRVTDCVEQPEKWYKKTHPRRAELDSMARGVLGDMLHQGIAEQPRQWKLYKSADLTLRHLDQLRLLESIEKKVRQLNEEANRFLLSDTQQLLHQLIEGSDTPFIFEKIGTQLENIMIDEFQDTSTVQWKNFKVLLEETMSHESSQSLIVGDVKQSIYRWRSGDWRLLANIGQEFPHAQAQLDIRTLDTNYRSSQNVVAFNNAFFTQAAKVEDISAYDDVVQKTPHSAPQGGYVDVTLLPTEDYQDLMLETLAQDIDLLKQHNIPDADIAILVRANSQIPLIANYLANRMPQVSIVSDEAFRLDASTAVMTIVQAMRLLMSPDDPIAKAYLAKIYSGQPLHTAPLSEMLPPMFVTSPETLARLPLYELAEKLYELFRLNRMEGQSAYLCAFYDQLASSVNEQATDLQSFLREWDETLCSKTIQSPEINGIRIISIHKSKGLEFPHVIIPFCDWRLEHPDLLWCSPTEPPFNQLPIVPIDFSQKGMTGTIYERDYEEEHLQNVVDNLNLLYVAFTRASISLQVIGKRNAKNNRSALLEMVLSPTANLLPGSNLSGETDEQAPLRFLYGSMQLQQAQEQTCIPHENIFLQKSTPVEVAIEVFAQKTQFRQSNRSRSFAVADDDDEQLQRYRYIQMGTVLHQLYSTIRTQADIPEALRRMEFEGIIYDQTLTRERIEQMISKRLSVPQIADWFSPHWTLFNECTILSTDPATGRTCERRPDRVMTDGEQTIVVDFKFGSPHDEHKQQVSQYMQLLNQMGHPHTQGFLWYFYSNQIIEVK